MKKRLIGMYKIKYSKVALKHLENLKASNLAKKAKILIDIIKNNPFQNPPPYEKLIGCDKYSRRLNIKHRLVYEVDNANKTIYVWSMWTHYEF